MTYPPPDPHRPAEPPQDPPPADPYLSPPGFDQPYGGAPGAPGPYQPASSPYGQPPPTPPYGQPPPTPPYGQPPPTPPYGQPPDYGAPPTQPFGAPPTSGPPFGYGPAGPPAGPPGPPGPPYGPYPHPPRRNRRTLWIAGAVAAVLLLCGGGGLAGLLLLQNADRDGAESPTAAVQAFLQAVYRDQNAELAAGLVCSESRDEAALETKIAEIAAYRDTYLEPRFTWTNPEVVSQGEELATVSTTVTMITGDERVSDLALQVTVLDKGQGGWWVCDLESGAPDPEEPPAGESPQPTEPAESGE